MYPPRLIDQIRCYYGPKTKEGHDEEERTVPERREHGTVPEERMVPKGFLL